MPNRTTDSVSPCAFTFADGRHCRMPRRNGHPYLCAFHTRKEAQALAAEQAAADIAYHLSGAFLSACDLNSALGRLFCAVAHGHIKPKTAATLAYLAQTLVQNVPHAQHEYINVYSTDAWRATIRESHNHSVNYMSGRQEPPAATPPRSSVPATPRSRHSVRAHSHSTSVTRHSPRRGPSAAPQPHESSSCAMSPHAPAAPATRTRPLTRARASAPPPPAPPAVLAKDMHRPAPPAPPPHSPLPATAAEFAEAVLSSFADRRST